MSGMRAWVIESPAHVDDCPLHLVEHDPPVPRTGEVRVAVAVCGVCRTDLHLAEGDLAVHRRGVIPGHEVVGHVDALGPGTSRFAVGDRVGVAWLASTCGVCRFCRRGDENLCTDATFTGWDRDGGYADAVVVDERFAYRLESNIPDEQVAPLLCAGIIGYRALCRADLRPGGRLGIYGFGGSAHLTAQVAMRQGAEVHVLTRSAKARHLAAELGVASVGAADAPAPVPLDAAIVFAPAGEVLPHALASLDRGGVAVIAGIHLSDIPPLDYQAHLFQERQLRSVTANTRRDGEEFLTLAARLGVRATTQPYAFADAGQALADLAHDAFVGAAVLRVSGT